MLFNQYTRYIYLFASNSTLIQVRNRFEGARFTQNYIVSEIPLEPRGILFFRRGFFSPSSRHLITNQLLHSFCHGKTHLLHTSKTIRMVYRRKRQSVETPVDRLLAIWKYFSYKIEVSATRG